MTSEHVPARRVVAVSAERLPGWLDGFAERHGNIQLRHDESTVWVTAADGAAASIRVPFGPLDSHADLRTALLDHVRQDRRVGAVLVRRGGYAVGVFHGRRLLASKVGQAYVQARTRAGGWSQQRYARRRKQQAGHLYAKAADTTALVLLPALPDLEAVVGGGDAAGVDAVLADPRLESLRTLRSGPVLPTPDPRWDVLRRFADQMRAVTITLNDRA